MRRGVACLGLQWRRSCPQAYLRFGKSPLEQFQHIAGLLPQRNGKSCYLTHSRLTPVAQAFDDPIQMLQNISVHKKNFNPRGTFSRSRSFRDGVVSVRAKFQRRKKSKGQLNLFALDRYRRNLNACAVNQGRDLDSCARRFRIGHHAFVNLVHVGELVNVGQIHGYADHVF